MKKLLPKIKSYFIKLELYKYFFITPKVTTNYFFNISCITTIAVIICDPSWQNYSEFAQANSELQAKHKKMTSLSPYLAIPML